MTKSKWPNMPQFCLLLVTAMSLGCGNNEEKSIGGFDILPRFLNSKAGRYVSPSGESFEFKKNKAVIHTDQRIIALRLQNVSPISDSIQISFSNKASTNDSQNTKIIDRSEFPASYISFLDKLREAGAYNEGMAINIYCHFEREFQLRQFLVIPKLPKGKKISWHLTNINAPKRKIKYVANISPKNISTKSTFTNYQLINTSQPHQKTGVSYPNKIPLPELSSFAPQNGGIKSRMVQVINEHCEKIGPPESSILAYNSDVELLFHDFTTRKFSLYPIQLTNYYNLGALALKHGIGSRTFVRLQATENTINAPSKNNKTDVKNLPQALNLTSFDTDLFFAPDYLRYNLYKSTTEGFADDPHYPSLSLQSPRESLTYDVENKILSYKAQKVIPITNSETTDLGHCSLKIDIKIERLEKNWLPMGPAELDIALIYKNIEPTFIDSETCRANSPLLKMIATTPPQLLKIFVHFPYINNHYNPTNITEYNERLALSFVNYDKNKKILTESIILDRFLPLPKEESK